METISQALLPALSTLLEPSHLLYLCIGVAVGLVIGFLPGLGGLAGLSLILPFTYGMEPTQALAMMVGLIAPTTTSDTFPAVLMGIPGTSASQATVLDGFPLAKKGQAARALSAAFVASLCGGVLGAVVLTCAIFAARPIILSFGFGEQLMLVVFSLSMVGMLTGPSVLKGLATCGLGLAIGSIGTAPATSEYRMTFGITYLTDGVSIVILGLGLFAVPEIIDLLRQQSVISERNPVGGGRLQGLRDVLRNKWIVVRCSLIGCLVGALPGLGGSVVDWIAYGHVVQTSRDRSGYGKGDIRGVIAPESANNAKEGGALIPTLLFGIPGSGSMALLLGGFLLIGIEPGMRMVTDHLDLTFTMIWSLAIANIIGAALCFGLATPISRLTTVSYALIGPIMIVVIFFAAFQLTRSWSDLVALFGAGLLGIYMKRFGWPRPALLIGFVLSAGFEASIYQATQIYGFSFFQRPLVLVILALSVVSAIAAILLRTPREEAVEAARQSMDLRMPQLAFTAVLVMFVAVVVADAASRKYLSGLFPLAVGVPTLILMLLVGAIQFARRGPSVTFFDSEATHRADHSILHFVGWIVGFLAATVVVGFPIAAALFVLTFTTAKLGWHVRNAILAAGVFGGLYVLARSLTLVYPGGLLQQILAMPRWLGAPL